jgi:hypothetical protein
MTARLETAGSRPGKKSASPPTASAAAPAGSKTSSVAFRQFLHARQAKNPKARAALNAPAAKPIAPTPERLGKADHPLRTSGGYYRVPAPIERLRNQGKLDPKPRINEAMYTAAQMLQQSFYNSGLSEHIKSQDLTGAGGGQSTASSHMPINEFAAHHRSKFLTACKRMGWYEPYPLRGCGRLVVDVICREMSVRDAGCKHFPNTRAESYQSAANDRLREGLFMLAVHWKLI